MILRSFGPLGERKASHYSLFVGLWVGGSGLWLSPKPKNLGPKTLHHPRSRNANHHKILNCNPYTDTLGNPIETHQAVRPSTPNNRDIVIRLVYKTNMKRIPNEHTERSTEARNSASRASRCSRALLPRSCGDGWEHQHGSLQANRAQALKLGLQGLGFFLVVGFGSTAVPDVICFSIFFGCFCYRVAERTAQKLNLKSPEKTRGAGHPFVRRETPP